MSAPSSSGRGMALKVGGVLVVTALCLGWFVWGLDLGQTWSTMLGFRLWVMVPVLLLSLGTLVVRTWRFQLLVDHPVPFGGMFSLMAVSFLAIGVIPLRLGELVRPYLLWEKHQVPVGTAFAGVVLERLLDLLALLIMLLLAALLVDLPPSGIDIGGVDLLQLGIRGVGGAVGLGLLAGLGFAIAGQAGIRLLVRLLTPISASLAGLAESLGGRFVDGFRTLAAKPARGLGALACTATVWAMMTLGTWLAMHGFDALQPTAELALVNWAATMTGNMLPTPGSVGGFEAACAGSLVVMGVGKELAGAYALILHAVIMFFNVGIGVVFLFVEGWSLVHLVKSSRTLGETD